MGWSECGICRTDYSADKSKDEAPCTGVCGHTICCACVRNLQMETLSQGYNRSGVFRYVKCPYCPERAAFDAHNIHASVVLCDALAEKYGGLAEKYSMLAARRTSSSTSNTSRSGAGDPQRHSPSRDPPTTSHNSSRSSHSSSSRSRSSSSRPCKRVKQEAEPVNSRHQQVIELHEDDDEDEEEQEADSVDRFNTDDVDDALDENWKNDSERDASVSNDTNSNRPTTTTTPSVPASAQDLVSKLKLPGFICGKGVDGIASLSENGSMLPKRFEDIFHLMDVLFAPPHPKGTRYELLFVNLNFPPKGGMKTRQWLRKFKKNNPTHKAVSWHQIKNQTWAPQNKTDLKEFVNLLNGLYQKQTGQTRSVAQSRPYC